MRLSIAFAIVAVASFLAGYGFAALAMDVEVQSAARSLRQAIDSSDEAGA